ncbi:hypothetical protein [Streptomyces montanisoli]|uniref:Uncharacterized protein n=1 Tax=Streptomyces montanisoli TaxID=2798581 RepID=A0A940MGD3_9ACTN|nr:hypothetical protein [Streptomyces montanisoli]MBP0458701.1 hypothetical protein [Streptomyces montanisoli]
MTSGETVARFTTGMTRTTVTKAPGGYVWTRRPGKDVRDDPHHTPGPVPDDFTRRAAAASGATFTFATPATWTDGAYTFHVGGHRSVAQLLMEGALKDAEAAAGGARAFGRHLKAFHTADAADPTRSAPGPEYPAPRYPARLASWLRTAAGTRAAPAFHTILREGLGAARWDTLAGYADEALSPRGDPAVVIGWATLGSLIVADDADAAAKEPGAAEGPGTADGAGAGPHAALLCGPDGAFAAPEIDLGCALGELHEIAASLTARGMDTEPVTAWREALLDGYGTPLDLARTARTAVVRIAAHAHDFAAYVGFHTELHAYVGMLADLLDNEGSQTTVITARERP